MKKIELDWSKVEKIVVNALREDVGTGDVTTNAIFTEQDRCEAVIVAKQSGILAGLPVVEKVFRMLDDEINWSEAKGDGGNVNRGEIIAEIGGKTRAVLTAERVALNFLQRLSGIASLTSRYVEAVEGFPVKILDTRKTAPGLRILDKYAVSVGGGYNHRIGLYGGVLIKDNHIKHAGNISKAVELVRAEVRETLRIEVETSSLRDVEEALNAGADIIMLDNMTLSKMKKAVQVIDKKALVEVSGGVRLEGIREIAEIGVDFISVGVLTHSPSALDIGLYMV